MGNLGLDGVRVFGSHHDYDGDQPWWTLRFERELTAKEQASVSARLIKSKAALDGNCSAPHWQSARQCQWETCDPWFSNQKAWQRFYAHVDEVFAALHANFPLTALFLQEGQFHEHEGPEENLSELTDEQLAAL